MFMEVNTAFETSY